MLAGYPVVDVQSYHFVSSYACVLCLLPMDSRLSNNVHLRRHGSRMALVRVLIGCQRGGYAGRVTFSSLFLEPIWMAQLEGWITLFLQTELEIAR